MRPLQAMDAPIHASGEWGLEAARGSHQRVAAKAAATETIEFEKGVPVPRVDLDVCSSHSGGVHSNQRPTHLPATAWEFVRMKKTRRGDLS